MSSSLVGSDPMPSPPATWTFSNELHLLRSVLDISSEPAKSFDPSISLFERIEKHLTMGAFSKDEILEKVKQLRKRYENGEELGGNGELVKICEKIWGIGRKRKGLKGKKRKTTKKKKVSNLPNDENKQLDNDLNPQKHFSAIISSSWAKRHGLGCCRNLPSSQDGFTKSSSRLTENIDKVELKRSSELVLAALSDVSRQDQDEHQEEPIEETSQTVAQPCDDGASHEPESPPHDEEPDRQKLLAESSCKIAENRFRLALQACTSGRGEQWASTAFSVGDDEPGEESESLCMSELVSGPFVDEYLKINGLEALDGMDAEEFDPFSVPFILKYDGDFSILM